MTDTTRATNPRFAGGAVGTGGADGTDVERALEAELERLMQIESFDPPPDFAAGALHDTSEYDRAAADPLAFWAEQARALDWSTPPTTILDDSNPPFFQWFTDGRINVSYNCLDRHVLAGNGDRVAFHWRGEQGEERDVTYADLLYFSRFLPTTYVVGDAARRDADGYFWIIGRIDDVINVSGHRLSTAEVESAIVAHEAVAEAAVVAKADEDTGQAIVAFVTLAGGRTGTDDTIEQLRDHVARRIGKLARPKQIFWSDDLPKTRSGKIMRRLLRDIAEGRELGDVTTLRDPEVMKQLKEKVELRPDAQ